MYEFTWGNEIRKIGEIEVPFPEMPDEKEIRNYHLKIQDQVFKPERLPKDAHKWPRAKKMDYAKQKWHRRIHGEWWFIRGEPYYFPGPCLPFFEDWIEEDGKHPIFRMEALELFWLWYLYVEPHPNVYGIFDLKARRIGDTAKFLYTGWERLTRYRDQRGGMQSYKESEALQNYSRLLSASLKMPYYFRNQYRGTGGSGNIEWKAPLERKTANKMIQGESYELADENFLGSELNVAASVTGAFDGQRLNWYFLDEIFKIPPGKFNAIDHWPIVKRTMSRYGEHQIIGKGIVASTVEEKNKNEENQSTIETAAYFWNRSNPNELDANGRTGTGLVRIFRGFECGAPVDKYGFHKIAAHTKRRKNKIDAARKAGDLAQLTAIFRKEPSSPKEALSLSTEKCVLYPDLVFDRIYQIENNINRYGNKIDHTGRRVTPKAIRGNLVWVNGRGSSVAWKPAMNGRWYISQHPIQPNGLIGTTYDQRKNRELKYPMGLSLYTAGCDPFDARKTIQKGSDGALVVFRRMDMEAEPYDLLTDEHGNVLNSEMMETNKFVCDYAARPDNPYEFYDDVLKTCWYYGVPVFVEIDKPGLDTWMYNNGYELFLQYEPSEILQGKRRAKPRRGTKMDKITLDRYVEYLKAYVYNYVYANDHLRILEDWRTFTVDRRTKHDMTVASGLALLANTAKTRSKVISNENDWNIALW